MYKKRYRMNSDTNDSQTLSNMKGSIVQMTVLFVLFVLVIYSAAVKFIVPQFR